MISTLRVFESFAGYGSQSMALKRLNIPFEVVGISEIDKYAIRAYMAVHGETPNYGDICKIDWSNVPDFDLFTYSFPCTDISSAGQQKGLTKGSGTRSGLLWECERAIEIKRPKYLLMENVKALVQNKFMQTFRLWQNFLTSLGYTNYVKVLNAKDFGVPQNRERVFMVSILGEEWFNFPETIRLNRCLGDVLESEVDDRYYLSQKLVDGFLKHRQNSEQILQGFKFEPRDITKEAVCIATQAGSRATDNFIDIRQVGNIVLGGNYSNLQRGRVYSSDGISPCLNAHSGGDLEPKILGYTRDSKGRVSSYHEKDVANTIHTTTGGGGNTDQFIIQKPRGFNKGGAFDISPTITSNARQENNFCCDKTYIRKLTPRECFRLMGVSEDDIDKIQTCHWLPETNLSYSKEERKKTMDNSTKKKLAKQGISNTQQYKMAGNSIVVDVLVKIFEQMFCSNSQKMTLFG